MIITMLAVILAMLTIIILIAVNYNKNEKNTESKQSLEGIWVYDESTKYEFDSDGKGGMYIGKTKYSYTFTIDDNELKIDFEDSAVHDAVYTFSVNGDKLKLVGGEGTVGGEYELRREK